MTKGTPGRHRLWSDWRVSLATGVTFRASRGALAPLGDQVSRLWGSKLIAAVALLLLAAGGLALHSHSSGKRTSARLFLNCKSDKGGEADRDNCGAIGPESIEDLARANSSRATRTV